MSSKRLKLDDLQQLLWRFAEHRVITVAGRTGMLKALAERKLTTDDLAGYLGLDRLATGKIVRALCALGLLEGDGDLYGLQPGLAEYFNPQSLDFTPFLEHSHSLYDSWGDNLEAWVRGEPWKTKKRDESGVQKFAAAMQAMGTNVAKRLTECLDLRHVERILDVGGGVGHYAKAFLDRSPEMCATVLDTPEVAALGQKQTRGTPFEGRLEFRGGDYLDGDWGTDYDLVLIANVIHQEKESSAAEMVRHGASALKPGGRLVVVDFSIDDRKRSRVMGALFAINMRSFGDTYSEPEIRGWMEQADLRDIQRTDLSHLRWMIVGRKTGSSQ